MLKKSCSFKCIYTHANHRLKVKSESVSHAVYLTFCDPMDWKPQAPLSIGFSRQEYWSVKQTNKKRILEWVAVPFSRDLPDSGIEPGPPALQIDTLPFEPPGKPIPAKIYPPFFFMYHLENMDHNAFPNHKIHFFNISFIYR